MTRYIPAKLPLPTKDIFQNESHLMWMYNFVKLRNLLQPEDVRIDGTFSTDIETRTLNAIFSIANSTFGHPNRHLNINDIVNLILEIYENSVIDKEKLKFLTKANSRIVNYAWLTINELDSLQHLDLMNIEKIQSPLVKNVQYSIAFRHQPIYQFYVTGPSPLSIDEIRKNIFQFFNVYEASRIFKETIIGKIRNAIDDIRKFESDFDWLDKKDEEQLNWAYNYMATRGILAQKYPTNSFEMKRNAIIASFDFNDSTFEAKKLLMFEMKRAWSTQKYRIKQSGKKPFSFVMSKKVEKMLNVLKTQSGESKNTIVERLITSEFELSQKK